MTASLCTPPPSSPRHARGVAWLLAGMAALGPPSRAAADAPRRYALIIGSNRTADPERPALAFADDDAARFQELFEAAGATTFLLTELDPESSPRFPRAARAAAPPTRVELEKALARAFAQLTEDRAASREAHFYFVFSGHGTLGPNREGALELLDGPLTRSELYREVVARSPAAFNHLLLDACNAYFVVHKRGGQGERVADFRAAVLEFLRSEELASYPNTGVILAGSSESETHEWGRWEAGLFSHELRSALLGGADLDGDGRVSYAEAAAFVESANAAVDVPSARLRVFARAPELRGEAPLLDLSAFEGAARLHVAPEHAASFHVEDARGVRVADFHSGREQAVALRLVGAAPFFVRIGDAAMEAMVAQGQTIEVGELAFAPVRSSAKGSVERSFRRLLFQIPFSRAFFSQLQGPVAGDASLAEARLAQEARSRRRGIAGWTAVLGGAAAVGAGAVFGALTLDAYRDAERHSGDPSDEVFQARKLAADRYKTFANVAYGVGAAAIGAGIYLLFTGERPGAAPTLSPGVATLPGGAAIVLSGGF